MQTNLPNDFHFAYFMCFIFAALLVIVNMANMCFNRKKKVSLFQFYSRTMTLCDGKMC